MIRHIPYGQELKTQAGAPDHNNCLQKIYLHNVSDKLSANRLTFLYTYATIMVLTYKKRAAKRPHKNEVRTSKSADYESNMNKTELFELLFHCNCKILYIFILYSNFLQLQLTPLTGTETRSRNESFDICREVATHTPHGDGNPNHPSP